MRNRGRWQRARLWAGAIVALLAAPALAHGDCGASGHDRDGSLAIAGHFDRLRHAGAIPRQPAGDSPMPTAPCSGPSCSRQPVAPPAPPPMTPGWRVESWCCLDLVLVPAPSPSRPRPTSEPGARPRHLGPTIFHPPRTPAA
ncbi:MAG TPA: hypothetical protein VG406_24810 [Isosphaeraceae bacterium]|jgi:hypothetical protein|nr:hypothetical protein [Isosphaeraceae bacterium]